MPQLILTIDLGTSGPKVSVFDEQLRLIDAAFKEVELLLVENGGVEQRVEDWIDSIEFCYDEIRQRAKFEPKEIIALNITSQWSGTVAIDRSGKPLMNGIIWMDCRGAKYADELTKGFPQVDGYALTKILKWIQITGGGPTKSGKDSVAHILFLKNERKEIYDKTYKFLEPKDFLNYYFTDKIVASDDSITLHWVTDNRNINDIKYHPSLLKMAGLEHEKLPDLVKANAVIGTVKKELAARFGLRDDVQVMAGCGDTHSAAIGSGAAKDFEAHLYIGTSSWLICHVPFKKTSLASNMAALPSAIPGKYLMLNEQETTGACLNFLKSNLFFAKDELNAEDAPKDFYKQLDLMANRVAAGSNGVIFLPWLNGERSPIDDHHARGGFYNVALKNNRADFVRAVFEGIALNNRWLLQYAEKFCKRPFEKVNFIGGGANSSVWSQIMADVMNKPIYQMKEPVSANSRGAAILALLALNKIKVEDIDKMVEVNKVFYPNPANRKVYDELFEQYTKIYERNKSIFKILNK